MPNPQSPHDYDNSEIDWKRPHTIVGSGAGQDVVFQDGKYFTSHGRRIQGPIDRVTLEKAGIPWSPAIGNIVAVEALRAEEAKLRKDLEEKIAALEKREKERVLKGLAESPSFRDKGEIPDDEELTAEEQVDQINLDGLDELEDEIEGDKKISRKSKPKK